MGQLGLPEMIIIGIIALLILDLKSCRNWQRTGQGDPRF